MVDDELARTISTQVKNAADDSNIANNGAHVAIGTVAYDTADLDGNTANAGGTATYYVEKGDATCSIAGATLARDQERRQRRGPGLGQLHLHLGRDLRVLGRLLGRCQQRWRHLDLPERDGDRRRQPHDDLHPGEERRRRLEHRRWCARRDRHRGLRHRRPGREHGQRRRHGHLLRREGGRDLLDRRRDLARDQERRQRRGPGLGQLHLHLGRDLRVLGRLLG